ncbi:MAG: 2-hydroxychromene-2-carboxylate isomerase [Lysobacteraceae bacterium]|nr:MAG: 2-hydroxychromene-2-carboxylate isomerase [Xanthomonadaceae bacterium]
MPHIVDYYFAPQSPWTYLGHARFKQITEAAGAEVRVLPADLGRVFPVSGGLPLAQRPQQRQAYRLVELRRFSEFLKLPLNLQPRFFPVKSDDAARLIIAADLHHGTDAAMQLTGRVLAACWAEERDIADAATLAALLAEAGLPAALLEQSRGAQPQACYDHNTQAAIELGVFGAPTYVVGGEMFWGQDRLDFLARALDRPTGA